MTPLRLVFVLVLASFGTLPVVASSADARLDADALRDRLAQEYPDFTVDAVRPTPLEGVYEVVSGTRVLYLSGDGRYLMRGSLIDLQSEDDLTAQRRSGLIHDAVDAAGEDSMLVYEPAQGPAEATVTVFTDTSCPYCQRLHTDLMRLIEQHPVRVRYLLFPRAGVQSAAADTMRDAWCADDPQAAMTAAQAGRAVPAREADCETPVEAHFALARRIGVSGTPYLLIGDDGPAVSGYRPPAQLLSLLGLAP